MIYLVLTPPVHELGQKSLAMVEERCINQQSELPSIQDRWHVLFFLHQLLLDEHHDFEAHNIGKKERFPFEPFINPIHTQHETI